MKALGLLEEERDERQEAADAQDKNGIEIHGKYLRTSCLLSVSQAQNGKSELPAAHPYGLYLILENHRRV